MPFKPEELPLIESYVQGYCDKRNKLEIYDKLHLEYEIENQSIILLEVRQHCKIQVDKLVLLSPR